MSSLVIRPGGSERIRQRCGAGRDRDVAEAIGMHPAQISRVLSGKHLPGNKFIAGVIDCMGTDLALRDVFEVIPEAGK